MYARTHAHTCCLLTLQCTSLLTHKEDAPLPLLLKQFNCSLIAFIIHLIQISAISSSQEDMHIMNYFDTGTF